MNITDLKDIHTGKRCFIIGNGPSLNKTNLKLLRDEITFSFNGIFLNFEKMGYIPTYYIVADQHYVAYHREEINNVNGTIKIFPTSYEHLIPSTPQTVFVNITATPHESRPNFSDNSSKYIKACYTVVYLAMQIAYYMGIREIYLVGVDHDWGRDVAQNPKNTSPHNAIENNNDVKYFHSEYIAKGESWMIPYFRGIEAGYSLAKEFYKEHDSKIYNATIGGKLEIFPRIDYNKLCKDTITLTK